MGSVYEVNGADVICGGIQTANATVYVINKVLTPGTDPGAGRDLRLWGLAQPDGQVRGFRRTVDGPGQVIADRIGVDRVFQPCRERHHGLMPPSMTVPVCNWAATTQPAVTAARATPRRGTARRSCRRG